MDQDQKARLLTELKKELIEFEAKVMVERVGTVIEIGDGVAQIFGLTDCFASEMLEFPGGISGVALNLLHDRIGAIVLGDFEKIKEGDLVKGTGRILEVGVGPQLLGRVVNPLGEPLDGKGSIKPNAYYPIEKIAPRVILREPVNRPIQTGIKAIDSMIPIGRGQRELIIGDRQTGKTAIVIDTIINQKNEDVFCIYVSIGQKESKLARIITELEKYGAMDYTIVVSASSSDPASLWYIAPYAGCAMGEYFMDQGKDALVIYDDLSKHAWAYRQISLVLRRPPGREAYPGDIFYLHSRLLERAAKLNKEHGGGSLTALPIIETQAGDFTSYIPTNVISITDGQIYLEPELFYQGIRPAINVGLSVSRVGSSAQIKAMRKVAGKLRLDLAQYREMAAFAEFSSDLDEATRKQLTRGKVMTEILKQNQYVPMAVEKQVMIIFAGISGLIDDVPVNKIRDFEDKFLKFMDSMHPEIGAEIKKTKDLTVEVEEKLKKYIEEFKGIFEKD
ncbi:MAG: F0F1 ATP synthase subunit alpha [candidate division WOR-3 bacterium]